MRNFGPFGKLRSPKPSNGSEPRTIYNKKTYWLFVIFVGHWKYYSSFNVFTGFADAA